jgi:hypothetical protein
MTQNDLKQIRGVVEDVLEVKLDEKLKPIHKKLDKLQKDLGATNKYFDDIAIKHEKRFDRIENQLHLPASTL